MPKIFTSRKFWVATAAVVVAVAGINNGYPVEQVLTITGPLMVYVGAQGVADLGKEKAKIDS